jgi:sugar/nucleoside kinase (ribokinase family)
VEENMHNVIVAGSIVLDIVMTMDLEKKKDLKALFGQGKITNVSGMIMYLGGVVGNTGLALKKMGIPVTLISKVGDDRMGEIAKKILSEFDPNAQITTVKGLNTTVSVAITPPNMDKISFLLLGAGQSFKLGDISQKSLRTAKLFHFGYPTAMKYLYDNDGESLVKMFAQAKQTNVTTSVDMTLPDMASESGKQDWNKIMRKMLPYVDIYMPSIEETLFMLDKEKYTEFISNIGNDNIIDHIDLNEIMEIGDTLLSMGPKIVVIKLGKKGLYLRTSKRDRFETFGRALPDNVDDWADRELWCEAFDTNPIVSTTGAGDTAIAGFIASLLRNYTPEKALEIGSYAASLCIRSSDTVSGIIDIEQMEKKVLTDIDRVTVDLSSRFWKRDINNKMYYSKRDRQ